MQETAIPISDPDVAVIITNSNVKRSLAQSAYAERLEQCRSAAKALGKSSLRDASENDVESKNSVTHFIFYHINSRLPSSICFILKCMLSLPSYLGISEE
jgi:galactokinase